MERYAKAAGITASCHSLRHTFASNLLEHGAEVVAIRDFLGHSQIALERAVCQTLESEDQTGVYANHAENLEAGPGVTQERYGVHNLYYKIIFVIYYSHKDHVWRDTT